MEAVTMRKINNWRMNSIDIQAENFNEVLELDKAVNAGILEKVDNSTWRIKA